MKNAISPQRPAPNRPAGLSRAGWRWALVALLVLPLCVACRQNPRKQTTIIVAGANSPEQRVLTQITVQYLRAKGFRVEDKTDLGEPWAVRTALESGGIDLCWEYTGDTWLVHMAHDQPIIDAELLWTKMRDEDARRDITWVVRAPAERSLGLVARADVAQANKWQTIADLIRHCMYRNAKMSLCVPQERYTPPSGIRGLERLYGYRFPEDLVQYGSIEEGYQAVINGECDCALGFTTDMPYHAPTLVMLQDNRAFFPPSHLAVAVRTPLLQEFPELSQALSDLAQALNQQALADMQRDLVEEKPATVAKRFLNEHDLLRDKPKQANEQ